MDLDGRVALVTGAGVRVGAAIATGLSQAGCHVALHYHRSSGPVQETAAAVRAAGREAHVIQADLTDVTAARGLAAAVVDRLGRIDVVVNSAAIMERQSIEEVTPESWDRTMALNLRAPFFVVQGAMPWLRRTRGRVVNIADVGSFQPWPSYIPHSVSKAAIVMLTKALARVLAPDVQVNAVAVGPVLLPPGWDDAAARDVVRRVPLGRLGSPGDALAAVLFLLQGTDFATGSTVVVDGGQLLG